MVYALVFVGLLTIAQTAYSWRLARALRKVPPLEDQVSRLTRSITLLVDTTEGCFDAVSKQLTRTDKVPTRTRTDKVPRTQSDKVPRTRSNKAPTRARSDKVLVPTGTRSDEVSTRTRTGEVPTGTRTGEIPVRTTASLQGPRRGVPSVRRSQTVKQIADRILMATDPGPSQGAS